MSEPIVLFPKGGLGNQIFALAAGWSVAAILGRNLHVNGSDLGWRGSNRNRTLELNLFDWSEFPNQILYSKTRKVFDYGNIGNRITSRLRQQFFDFKFETAKEDHPEYLDSILKAAIKGRALDGNYINFKWLDLAYQNGFPAEFKLLTFNPEFAQAQSDTAVHIRLGDFLKYPEIFPVPSPSYYDEALSKLSKGNYDVYTDDKTLARQMYPKLVRHSERLISGEDLSGPATFCKLSSYNKIITSASTFSSVAAWGIAKRGGTVVCPERMLLTEENDSRPEDWIRVKF